MRELFPDLKFSDTVYKNRLKKVKETFSKLGKNSADRKLEVVGAFSSLKWNELSPYEKKKHGDFKCKGCLGSEKYRVVLSMLPINLNDSLGKKRAEESGLFKPIRQQVLEATKKDLNRLNYEYKNDFSMTFESAYNIVKNKETEKKRTEIAKELKENVENQWEETAVSRLNYV